MTFSGLQLAGWQTHAGTATHMRRVARAETAIRDLKRFAVAWSGGKDSTVLLDIAARCWPGGWVQIGWNQDGTATAAMADLILAWLPRIGHLDVLIQRSADAQALGPQFDRLDVRGCVTGLRAAESGRRRRIANSLARGGYVSGESFGRRPVVCPLIDWTDDDVWAYITTRGLPYHQTYDLEGPSARSPHPALSRQ